MVPCLSLRIGHVSFDILPLIAEASLRLEPRHFPIHRYLSIFLCCSIHLSLSVRAVFQFFRAAHSAP